jgi:Protein of unknown function (DUF4232)
MPNITAMGRKRIAAPALVAVLAALIAGCGSSQSGGGVSTNATSGSTRTVTRTVTAGHHSSSSSSTAPVTASSSSSPASSTTPSSRTGAAAAASCRAGGVRLIYLGGQGATGHGLLGFAIRNTGGSACTTVGYPGIEFLSKGGAPLPTHPQHTTNDFFGKTRYGQVTVAPGQTSSFRLGVTHGLASAKGCVTAVSVQVIVPNDTVRTAIRIPGGVYECRGIVTVSPMQPGNSAYHAG